MRNPASSIPYTRDCKFVFVDAGPRGTTARQSQVRRTFRLLALRRNQAFRNASRFCLTQPNGYVYRTVPPFKHLSVFVGYTYLDD